MAQVAAETGRPGMDEEALTAGVGLALLTGLVSDLNVAAAADGIGTEVRMSWPVGRRGGTDPPAQRRPPTHAADRCPA